MPRTPVVATERNERNEWEESALRDDIAYSKT